MQFDINSLKNRHLIIVSCMIAKIHKIIPRKMAAIEFFFEKVIEIMGC